MRDCLNLKRPSKRRTPFRPVVCSYNLHGPILCCNEPKERVSQKKCNEYKKLVEVGNRVIIDRDFDVLSVAGGFETEISEFPHMAAIGFKLSDESIQWKCGATLISDEFVMTAAHCINFGDNELDFIRISDHNLYESSDDTNVQERTVAEIFTHPLYKPTSTYHDIALIRLNEKVELNNVTRPACLCVIDPETDSSVIATGWGLTAYGGSPSEELLKVELLIYDQEKCVEYYGKGRKFRRGIIQEQLCAGDPTGEQDTCEGDSGGAIQLKRVENGGTIYHVVGITSFGKACGIVENPSVYTRVSKYVDWIESIVWPTG
ncbi:serine protease snake-like [Culicoides brevitarsis]|uniref:serine protease snake-like n=1 Tax=Culicoides brevitarsis TaxID=469753 RepID=UPI00307C0757